MVGQSDVFGLPTDFTINKLRINVKTYRSLLKDLIEWGVLEEVQPSVNQYQSIVLRYGKKWISIYLSTGKSTYLTIGLGNGQSTTPINNLEYIDNNNNINKDNIIAKHSFNKSAFKEYEAFEKEFIRLGEIQLGDKHYKPTDFNISHYWNNAKEYGEDKSKKYANWVVSVRSWIRSAYTKGQQPQFSKTRIPENEWLQKIGQMAAMIIGEDYNYFTKFSKGNKDVEAEMLRILDQDHQIYLKDNNTFAKRA